jgi:hypothetical protein
MTPNERHGQAQYMADITISRHDATIDVFDDGPGIEMPAYFREELSATVRFALSYPDVGKELYLLWDAEPGRRKFSGSLRDGRRLNFRRHRGTNSSMVVAQKGSGRQESEALIRQSTDPSIHQIGLVGGFRAILQNFAGLAVQVFADGFEGGEADGAGATGLENGKVLGRDVHGVGQVVQAHFALGEDDIQIDDDGHGL